MDLAGVMVRMALPCVDVIIYRGHTLYHLSVRPMRMLKEWVRIIPGVLLHWIQGMSVHRQALKPVLAGGHKRHHSHDQSLPLGNILHAKQETLVHLEIIVPSTSHTMTHHGLVLLSHRLPVDPLPAKPRLRDPSHIDRH